MVRSVRVGAQLLVMLLAALFAATPAAHAQSWHTFDTDDISRSAASGRAYTNGSFKWQNLTDEGFNYQEDYRATFSTSLVVNGAKGSCAWLRIFTYSQSTGSNTTDELSKRFPAAGATTYGYYKTCAADGSGSATFSGSDELWSDVSGNEFARADIRVCYTTGSSVPPGDLCYAFTIHPGD